MNITLENINELKSKPIKEQVEILVDYLFEKEPMTFDENIKKELLLNFKPILQTMRSVNSEYEASVLYGEDSNFFIDEVVKRLT